LFELIHIRVCPNTHIRVTGNTLIRVFIITLIWVLKAVSNKQERIVFYIVDNNKQLKTCAEVLDVSKFT